MKANFEIELLSDVIEFLENLDDKPREKIYYNLKKSQSVSDDELFKKLNQFIWEFRTSYNGKYYRLLSFWEKKEGPLVIATHGFVKKTAKTPPKEIRRAEEIRKQYLDNKSKRK